MDPEMVPGEMDVHLAPSGPAAAALHWLRLVLDDGDIAAAWPLTDENLRLALVQLLIWATQDSERPFDQWVMDQLAHDLSRPEPAFEDWPAMQRGLLRILREKWKDAPALEHLASLRPRIVDPVHELVFLVDGAKHTVIAAGESFLALAFLMANREGRWLVAGFSDKPPTPGWPPSFPPEDRLALT